MSAPMPSEGVPSSRGRVAMAALCMTGLVSGCGSAQAAAAKDPLRCERDPSCARAKGSFPDCTKQCTDDQECESRCEQVQQAVDGVGHP
jgi:hypothetical protein